MKKKYFCGWSVVLLFWTAGCHTYPLPHNLLSLPIAEQDRLLNDAIRLEPDVPEFRLEHADVLAKQGRIREAIERAKEAVALRKKYFKALEKLGDLYSELQLMRDPQKDPSVESLQKKSLASYEEALKYAPYEERIRYKLGRKYEEIGQIDVALFLYRGIKVDEKYTTAAMSRIGTIFLQKGELDEAEEHFKQALTENSGNGEAQCGLGSVYLKKGDQDKAIERFISCSKRLSDAWEPRLELAKIYRIKGDRENEQKALEQAIQKKGPCSLKARLAQLMMEKNSLLDAKSMAMEALQCDPSAETHWILSLILNRLNDGENAKLHMQSACKQSKTKEEMEKYCPR